MLLYVKYGADVIAPIGTLCWLHRCYVHYLWHRCYCALWMAQMLLCPFHVIYYCTGVIVHYLWPRCYWAIFCLFFFVFFCSFCWAITSFSVLGYWIIYYPRCVGDCIFQYSYWVWDYSLLCTLTLIVLAKLLSSLPIILKFSMDISCPLMFWCWNIGDGAFKCSLYLSPNVLPDSKLWRIIIFGKS